MEISKLKRVHHFGIFIQRRILTNVIKRAHLITNCTQGIHNKQDLQYDKMHIFRVTSNQLKRFRLKEQINKF